MYTVRAHSTRYTGVDSGRDGAGDGDEIDRGGYEGRAGDVGARERWGFEAGVGATGSREGGVGDEDVG